MYIYRMAKSLCKGKSVRNPNKCKKTRGCKVATGKKRSFCRKKRNMTKSKKKVTKKRQRLPEVARLRGLNMKQYRELKRLGHI
jgi:hypothetical protein